MKQFSFRTMLIVALMIASLSTLHAQFYYENNHLFVGPRYSTPSSAYPNYFLSTYFGIEYFENGINIWRPYPASNYANYLMFIDESGKIGIGRKPTAYALEVNGQVWTTSGLLVASDRKLKKDIADLKDNSSGYLNRLFQLKGKSYSKQLTSSEGNAGEVSKMVASGKIKQSDAPAALQVLYPKVNNLRKR